MIRNRIDKIKSNLQLDQPIISFIERNRELINELSKDSWCLRLLVITCKENNVSDSIIHIIHCYYVCYFIYNKQK